MRDRRWPDALGRYLPAAAARDMYRPALADLRLEWLRMYFPFERAPQLSTGLFVHTVTDPLQAMPSIRRALRGLEPNVMLEEGRSIDEVAAASASVTRLAMRLLGGFALMALALAALVLGVTAMAACYLPARRAARVDPAETLASE